MDFSKLKRLKLPFNLRNIVLSMDITQEESISALGATRGEAENCKEGQLLAENDLCHKVKEEDDQIKRCTTPIATETLDGFQSNRIVALTSCIPPTAKKIKFMDSQKKIDPDAKMKMRSIRFGLVDEVDVFRKRTERFGVNSKAELRKIPLVKIANYDPADEEKLEMRKKRFRLA